MALLVAAACAHCAAADAKPSAAAASAPVEVAVVTLRREEVALPTELVGRTAAFRTVEVRPQVTGIIQARKFVEGSNVKAGELLYSIDAAVYRAAHAKARAELASAEANLVTSATTGSRIRRSCASTSTTPSSARSGCRTTTSTTR